MKRICSIDIGTNTNLMLIADVAENGSLSVILDEQIIARLGKGVDKHRRILPETFVRVRNSLESYKNIAHNQHCDTIIACGTSALRDAINKKEFIQYIQSEIGIEICILSGDEEAELTYKGTIYEHVREHPSRMFAVLDIGGGSTELCLGTSEGMKHRRSIDVGSVRLTERILKDSPPTSTQIVKAREFVRSQISLFTLESKSTHLLGVAGTLTTLAALDLQLSHFNPDKVNKYVLTLDRVQYQFDRLKNLSNHQIVSLPQISSGREDVILAGTLILIEILKHLGVNSITVSTRGLRYGMALKSRWIL